LFQDIVLPLAHPYSFVATSSTVGEAEASSAGEQLAKEYPTGNSSTDELGVALKRHALFLSSDSQIIIG
jgi:hypothetical protein